MGEGIALLARARFERAAGYATSRTFAIEAAMTLARERDDIPLLAQAHTALGDEFVAVGAVERGLNRYRTMLDLTRPTEGPAIAHWAEVALIRPSTREIAVRRNPGPNVKWCAGCPKSREVLECSRTSRVNPL